MSVPAFRRPLARAISIALVLAVSGGAALAAVDAAKIHEDREANFKKMGGALKAINEQIKSGSPDVSVITEKAKIIKDIAPQIVTWFPAGSGPESGVKMKAKAEIWTDKAGFAAAAKGLETESAKLYSAAQSGNLDAIKAQIMPTGGACKTCHTKFREAD